MLILLKWVKYYTKEFAKALKIISIGAITIITIILIKYKPAYKVTLAGEELGYVGSKEKLELKIKNYLENRAGNIAFVEQTVSPEFNLKLINRDKEFKDKQIKLAIENSMITTYRVYAVTIDGNIQTTVLTENEAQNAINVVKENLNSEIDLGAGIIEQFITDLSVQSQDEAIQILDNVKLAKTAEYNAIKEMERKKIEQEQKSIVINKKTATDVGAIAGISLRKPVSGTITSRYGSRSSMRSGPHTGLDIGVPKGTSIMPIASGTVTFASYKGSYGNLVIVDHGNGIESYYAHCSKILSTVGQIVDINTVIATVGSTGNSTGPHLHLEIRQNNLPLNPEDYLY